MLVLLLAVALIGPIVLALLLAGAFAALAAGILTFNACLLIAALHRRPPDPARRVAEIDERWRPSSFRAPPAPPGEHDELEPTPALRVTRL